MKRYVFVKIATIHGKQNKLKMPSVTSTGHPRNVPCEELQETPRPRKQGLHSNKVIISRF